MTRANLRPPTPSSIPSMPAAPINICCSPRCCRRRPRRNCSARSPNLKATTRRLAAPMPRWRRPRRMRSPPASEREYFDLFIGVGRGEILPYASYYLTGFLHERPLARLRGDLPLFGIERVDNNPEPEDNAATLCEIMAGFADGRFAATHRAAAEILRQARRALDGPHVCRSGEVRDRQILPDRSARLAGCSWKSNPKHSSSPTDQRLLGPGEMR